MFLVAGNEDENIYEKNSENIRGGDNANLNIWKSMDLSMVKTSTTIVDIQ